MAFQGANVFLSRSLVAPEIFDAVHDALLTNRAQVALCCDPSRNSPDDFHVISSYTHEKFELLRMNGCNLVGPECVLFCAKERRTLPKHGYTCCFAMEGAKVLVSGFDQQEKSKIETMVTAMSGVLQAKVSLDISFVIVKNVQAAKYKWASRVLQKPVVTLGWLNECWDEHRVVPQEPHRILPFVGLTICATGLRLDEKKELLEIIHQNGGQYSKDLTRMCTHLIANAPEGDKYKVAQRWGSVRIVNPNWIQQSMITRVCQDEDRFRVKNASSVSNNPIRVRQKPANNGQEAAYSISQSTANFECNSSETMSTTLSNATVRASFNSPAVLAREGSKSDACCIDVHDLEAEDDDLYLADCRILLAGFQVSEMRELVRMIRKGGGSRYMSFNEKLTHIIVGIPSEIEKNEISQLAAWGVINIVRRNWLEDCHHSKKEAPVSSRHIVSDSLILKSSTPFEEFMGKSGAVHTATVAEPVKFSAEHISSDSMHDMRPPMEENGDISNGKSGPFELSTKSCKFLEPAVSLGTHVRPLTGRISTRLEHKARDDSLLHSKRNGVKDVFRGRIFCFSRSFPEDQRPEVTEWVTQGGGLVAVAQDKKTDFIIACHGARNSDITHPTLVSTHWIKFCFEEGLLQDIGSHILFSPLQCRVPLPGFESFLVCVSHQDRKEKALLRNLCFVLGAKFTEKLGRRVTHLICKFMEGPKYEAACNWGLKSITAEWIFQCVKEDRVVPCEPFLPKAATIQDIEAGICTVSQYPTQTQCTVGETLSQSVTNKTVNVEATSQDIQEHRKHLRGTKRILRTDDEKDLNSTETASHIKSAFEILKTKKIKGLEESSSDGCAGKVSDVAAAIEDLLAQSSKMQDTNYGTTDANQTLFSSEQSILSQSKTDSWPAYVVPPGLWLNRLENGDNQQPHLDAEGNQRHYDGFTETQMESQVVEYEEDLAGRQMIIDRVRTRSMVSTSKEKSGAEDDHLGRLLRVANQNK